MMSSGDFVRGLMRRQTWTEPRYSLWQLAAWIAITALVTAVLTLWGFFQ